MSHNPLSPLLSTHFLSPPPLPPFLPGYGGNASHGGDGANGSDGVNGGDATSLIEGQSALVSETSMEILRTQDKTSTMRRVLVSPHMQVFFLLNHNDFYFSLDRFLLLLLLYFLLLIIHQSLGLCTSEFIGLYFDCGKRRKWREWRKGRFLFSFLFLSLIFAFSFPHLFTISFFRQWRFDFFFFCFLKGGKKRTEARKLGLFSLFFIFLFFYL